MSKMIKALVLSAFVAAGFFGTAGCQTSHTESDKTTLTGAHKHEETTTTKNPITGDTSTSHTEQTTR
jgi:hypothetical protein